MSTPYINTIPAAEEAWFPGDEYLEGRIRRFIRWNAAMMVIRANKAADGIGGHLSTFASSAILYEVGFNHFFRGKEDGIPGDHIYIQGHAAPGIYARSYLEHRLDEQDLDRFRREIGGGLSSYPHPRLMPDYWEFPTVSMGLGPINSLYQARFLKYLHNRRHRRHLAVPGVVLHRRRRGRRAGDAGVDLAGGPGEAGQPHLGDQLQPAAARRPGPGQREDHPGARGGLPRCRVERDQGHLGQQLGRAARPATSTGVLVDKMNRTVDGEYQRFKAESGAFVRENFFGPDPGCASWSRA